jgi:hypothetical protein
VLISILPVPVVGGSHPSPALIKRKDKAINPNAVRKHVKDAVISPTPEERDTAVEELVAAFEEGGVSRGEIELGPYF